MDDAVESNNSDTARVISIDNGRGKIEKFHDPDATKHMVCDKTLFEDLQSY